MGSDKLFSIEVALLTKQPTISSDLFISALYEMEPDLIAEITTVILEVSADQLLAYDGREKLSWLFKDTLMNTLLVWICFPVLQKYSSPTLILCELGTNFAILQKHWREL